MSDLTRDQLIENIQTAIEQYAQDSGGDIDVDVYDLAENVALSLARAGVLREAAE